MFIIGRVIVDNVLWDFVSNLYSIFHYAILCYNLSF